ncbi:MAG: hypothetical protein ACETWE_08680 [Candidatus Bathyarchaeia archaeon]
MSTKLVAYEHVPIGFEMVIENEKVKAWNLWWNTRLNDDPETWDNEIKLVNKMQGRLGELTANQRLVRAHMAEFCRYHPLFPQSIDILCEEIGTGRFSKPVRIGCEGYGLLNSLGYHDLPSLKEQRKEILTDYARSLEKWLVQGRPENPTESRVFSFLGQSTNTKEAFIEKLISFINPEEPSISSIKKLSEDECSGKSILDRPKVGYPFCCFGCDAFDWLAPLPKCQCCYSMILDAGLLCAGTFGEKRSMVDEFRHFIEENILAYAVAINSWLKEVPLKHVPPIKTDALEIAERVHSSLGEKDEAKEWLTACLLKTIKDNQRWEGLKFKRTELIDDFLDATSWFGEKHVGTTEALQTKPAQHLRGS